MSRTIDFIFDFGSPNAYLAYHALQPILIRTGATLKLSSCLLGGIFKATGNQPPMISYGHVKAKMDYMATENKRFIERHGLTKFEFNPHFPVNTLMLMRGAIVAENEGRLKEYIEAGLQQVWEEGLKMDVPEVFITAMDKAGFAGEKILEQTQQPEVKAKLIENTQNAVARGVFGIPSFFVAGALYFGKDRLAEVEEALTK